MFEAVQDARTTQDVDLKFPDLGQRIIAVARMAVAMHLKELAQQQSSLRNSGQQVRIGRADPQGGAASDTLTSAAAARALDRSTDGPLPAESPLGCPFCPGDGEPR